MIPDFPDSIWAKDTGETLLEHTLNVVAVARTLCENLPFSPEERAAIFDLLKPLAVFHDLGKCASGFQAALRSHSGWGRRHEILSTALAAQLNPHLEQEGLFAVLTHHRSIPDVDGTAKEKCLPQPELPADFAPIWDEMVTELRENEDALRLLLGALTRSLTIPFSPVSLDALKLGLSRAWLNRTFQQSHLETRRRRRASFLRGLLVTSDHLASAGERTVPRVPRLTEYESSIRASELKDHSPFPFQRRCGEIRGDLLLRAPTGSGKTYAMALWAQANQSENGRFLYTLPHTASINAMYRRLLGWFDNRKDLVGILHHRSAAFLFELLEEESFTQEENRRNLNRRAAAMRGLAHEMYHPIRVCTPHQLLRISLKGKGWETGLAELPNACVVFDEVHAYEPLLTGLTLATARWLKEQGAKLLFASATMPKFLERLIVETLQFPQEHCVSPNPNLTGDRDVCDKVRHRVQMRDGTLIDALPEIAAEIRESGATTLIVCNHVATSQRVWRTLRESYGIEATLLHSRFNGRDRADIESRITGDTPPRVLVATQAVEVSLDLDYARGYSEPAPIDAMGQRFGRINRKGERPPAPVVVFKEPSAGHLYDESLTNRTVALLSETELLTEQHLTDMVDAVYADGYQDAALAEFERGLNHDSIRRFDEDITAGTYRDWVEIVINGSDKQIEVLPFSSEEEFRLCRKEGRYVEARMLLVPIRLGQYHKAVRDRFLYRDDQLRELVTTLKYSPESGLDLSQQIDNIF